MRRIRFFILIILSTLIMSGCAILPTESTDRISSPKNNYSPVSGTWEIIKVVEGNLNTENPNDKEWKEKTLEFSEGYMSLGDYYLESPRYQVKQVNGKDYMLYNHKPFLKNFDIPDAEIEVITVIDKDKYFCEIIRINEDELILSINNYSFHLKKIYNEVETSLKAQENQNDTNSYNLLTYKEDSLTRSGVLLGLRSNDSNKYSYRTIWISSNNKILNPVLETEGIIFPRRSGFWKIETKRNIESERIEDFLFAYNISTDNIDEVKELQIDYLNWLGKLGQIHKRIDYIGNDYVSIEAVGNGSYEHNGKKWYENTLNILPIDSLSSKKNVKFTDISGEEDFSSLKLGIEKITDKLKIKESDLINKEKFLDSFGLERKMGHWVFKGRINYMFDDGFHFADYNINIIPPYKLVFYDDLNIPWTNIKNRVPEAIDAFTSPNRDIVLVFTRKEIMVYGIEKGEIGKAPLKRIDLKDNEAVIMAEWATGDYVENWTETLNNFNEKD
ncbi:hypothetical protein [Proteiniborus sp.]|uniref:hypothetical protein n=1 Tax=Proteiniborus sp. TaxID=2079015 RepID=UPI00331E0819